MDINRLLKMTAMKPRILKEPPTNDIGGEGDFALQVDSSGITLYVKYLKEWWFLTKAQKAAAKGTGRPIVQPEDTHHKTINAEKIKLKKNPHGLKTFLKRELRFLQETKEQSFQIWMKFIKLNQKILQKI